MKPPVEEQAEPEVKKSSKKIIFFIILFILVVASLIMFRLMGRDKNNRPAPKNTAQSTTQQKPDPSIKLTQFAIGLTSPTGIVSTKQADDKRLFVLDRSGQIRIIDEKGQVSSQPFLDISGKVLAQGEMGLLGLAFSPYYAKDGYFFVNYVNKSQETVVARFKVSSDTNKADPASETEVLRFKQPYVNHKGGDLLFGADGYLYIAVGDGGSAGDPENRAQNLDVFFGKILRIDVRTLPYKVPPSNPFANQANKKGEIWDYGLRNPWRISFDSGTNDFYIADVGQDKMEEINVEKAGNKGGNNYGWRCWEGQLEYNQATCGPKTNYIFPSITYDHADKKCSLTGGYVYRGQKYPNMSGRYFYGDFCTGDVFWSEKTTGNWSSKLALKSPSQISTFGEDNKGELYLADFKTGTIYHIEDTTAH